MLQLPARVRLDGKELQSSWDLDSLASALARLIVNPSLSVPTSIVESGHKHLPVIVSIKLLNAIVQRSIVAVAVTDYFLS